MKKLTPVYLKITYCQKCPYVDIERAWTADSFESCFNYLCKAKKDKMIEDFVEWHEKGPKPPTWCPLRKKYKKRKA